MRCNNSVIKPVDDQKSFIKIKTYIKFSTTNCKKQILTLTIIKQEFDAKMDPDAGGVLIDQCTVGMIQKKTISIVTNLHEEIPQLSIIL